MTVPPARAVVDATVAVKWVVAEPDSDRALLLRGALLHAPDLLVAECANVLWKKVARGELLAAEAETAALALASAEVELVPMRPAMERVVRLASLLGHPAYDCCYLVAAADLGLPLVTSDARLARAVRSAPPGACTATVILLEELQGA